MAEKSMHTEPFHSGQQSNAKGFGSEKTVLKSNMSKKRNAGGPDPLANAIRGRDSYLPSNGHPFHHSKTSKSGGTHYNPAGEFGRPTGKMMSKATDYPSHTSRPGENALGYKRNLKGDNPLGGHGGSGTFRGKP